MNIARPRRINIPIVFDSDDSYYSESYDDYSGSEYESENEEPIIMVKKSSVPNPPSNNSIRRPPVYRRPIHFKPNNLILKNQKATSVPDHFQSEPSEQIEQKDLQSEQKSSQSEPIILQNDTNDQIITSKDTPQFEIVHNEFVEYHTYALVEKKNSTVFKKSRTFSLVDKGNTIHQVTVNSLSKCKIKLSKDVIMYVRNSRTEFVIKTNEKKSKSLSMVSFSTPFSFEECKRKTTIRFSHTTGGMLPHKIVSLPTATEEVFNGHYFIKSKRNVAFAVVNNSKPVLIARQIQEDMMEVDTILNIPSVILFGLAIALYVGKNKIPQPEVDEEDRQKFHILNLTKIMKDV